MAHTHRNLAAPSPLLFINTSLSYILPFLHLLAGPPSPQPSHCRPHHSNHFQPASSYINMKRGICQYSLPAGAGPPPPVPTTVIPASLDAAQIGLRPLITSFLVLPQLCRAEAGIPVQIHLPQSHRCRHTHTQTCMPTGTVTSIFLNTHDVHTYT